MFNRVIPLGSGGQPGATAMACVVLGPDTNSGGFSFPNPHLLGETPSTHAGYLCSGSWGIAVMDLTMFWGGLCKEKPFGVQCLVSYLVGSWKIRMLGADGGPACVVSQGSLRTLSQPFAVLN